MFFNNSKIIYRIIKTKLHVNTGAMFGIPTFVSGAPRMFGAKLT